MIDVDDVKRELLRSDGLRRSIFDGSFDALLLSDDQGKVVDANSVACELFGLPRTALLGRSLMEFAAPGYDVEANDRALREHGTTRGRFPLLRRDGVRRVLDYSARACVAPGLHLSALRDITDQIEADQKLRASRHMLEEAQAIAHVGSWTSGLGSEDEIVWSSECYRIFGVQQGTEVTVNTFFAHVHPEDRERVQRASRDAWEGGAPYDIAHRVLRSDGSVRWVQEHGIVERDEANRPIGMIGTLQDITDRHLADEALRTSEGEFRLLAEAMPQIVWITRPDGGNLYFNQQWMDYTGLTLEESLGSGWNKPFHPDDKARAWQTWQHATATSGTYSLECRLRRADGIYLWWLIRGVPIRNASGDILKWFGTCTDIEALKQAHTRIAEREERLRVLHAVSDVMRVAAEPLEALPEVIHMLGEHLHVSRCAFAMVEANSCNVLYDYTDGCPSIVGRHSLAELGLSGAPLVVRDVDAPGALGIEAFVSSPLFEGGSLRAIVAVHQTSARDWAVEEIAIVQEVAERIWSTIQKRAADAKLRENEALLRVAGRAARLGGWSVSVPGSHVTWSEEVCAIHEVPPGSAPPSMEEVLAYYAPESQEIIRDKFDACVRDGTPFDLELQIVTASGRRVWVRAIGEAERNVSGAITCVRGAFQDIDDRRRLQEQFRQAQKMEAVGRLAGGIAHDFNNLLTVVLSYSELSLADLKSGDPLRDDIGEIQKAAQRATALTHQLLAFSRQQVLEPRVVGLSEIVGGMKAMLGRLLGEDIDLTVLSSGSVGRVLVDPAQVEQVLMNLAVNARDAMLDGGQLTIETSNVRVDEAYSGKPADVPAGAFVMLAVTDTGVGMSEATRARIFEPFFTTKEKGRGTGLGLATVFGIVQQSAGYVTVYSELGHGTTFKVFLPRTDRVADAATTDLPSDARGGSETILLVEDEDQVRTVACAILRKHGYHVIETSNGGEAFLVSNDFTARIDLLLTDVIMPRMSGRRLAEQLALHRPEMKVLFASGYTDDAIIHHGVLDAGVAFLQKPFTPQTLLKKIRETLDSARSQRPSLTRPV